MSSSIFEIVLNHGFDSNKISKTIILAIFVLLITSILIEYCNENWFNWKSKTNNTEWEVCTVIWRVGQKMQGKLTSSSNFEIMLNYN